MASAFYKIYHSCSINYYFNISLLNNIRLLPKVSDRQNFSRNSVHSECIWGVCFLFGLLAPDSLCVSTWSPSNTRNALSCLSDVFCFVLSIFEEEKIFLCLHVCCYLYDPSAFSVHLPPPSSCRTRSRCFCLCTPTRRLPHSRPAGLPTRDVWNNLTGSRSIRNMIAGN